jgi:hypothetical protein
MRHIAARLGPWSSISFGALFGVLTLGLLAIETLGYLKSGSWNFVTQVGGVVTPFLSPTQARWLYAPADWLGLHAIVSPLLRLPLWLPSAVLSVGLIVAGINDLQFLPNYDAVERADGDEDARCR